VRLSNSERLKSLIRAGTLYLTLQDAIALVLENNIDIEVARYNPILAQWQLERARAGGALPGVPAVASQAGSVASGQGVAGSEAAAGVVSTQGNTTSNKNGNATISQVGPVAQTLDPAFQSSMIFSHTSAPQFNSSLSFTSVLISTTHVYNASLQQGFLTGGSATVSYTDHYLKENAPTDILNPTVAPSVSISVQHNFLRGFGIAVNARNIRAQEIGLKTADLNFKSQVINAVVQTLDLYYGLSADYEDVTAKQSALELSQTLYRDNKKQVQIGSLAPLDLTTAESQVAASDRDLVVSRTTLQQDEVKLKNLLSRTGSADPILRSVRIMPLDRIVMPEKDDLPPVQEMVQQALANRADLAAEKANEHTAEVLAVGTKNGLLPSLQGFVNESAAGLAGARRAINVNGRPFTADPYFAGGIGTALGEVLRHNFPTNVGGAFFQAPLKNRQAQADYGIDQLSLRQTQLTNQKDINQVQVDLMNAVVAIQQARARYEAAVRNKVLAQQLLDSERKKYGLGASTPYLVAQQQRDLATAQSSVITALVTWSNARISLEQILGTTLEANHIVLAEAQSGKVNRVSTPPQN
jgi:outer membrane protein TolC